MRLAPFPLITAVLLMAGASAAARQELPTADSAGAAARADAARQANRPEEAMALYREALASRPEWAEGWFHLGALLYSRDECGDAAAAFAQAVALRPDVGTGWAMLGLCEFQLGKHDEAITSLRTARGKGLDRQLRPVVGYHEGLLLLGRGEFERAQEVLASLAAEGLDDEPLLIALGQSVLRIGGPEAPADEKTREMLLTAGRAELHAARKQFAEAEREYGRLASGYADVRNVHYAVGRHLGATSQPDRAAAAYERELEGFPDHVPALIALAAIKGETDPHAALPYAEKAVTINPRIPLGHYVLGSLLLRVGDVERAIVELETAERSVREDPGLYFALSRAYARAGRKDDAERARGVFTRLTEARQEAAERDAERIEAGER